MSETWKAQRSSLKISLTTDDGEEVTEGERYAWNFFVLIFANLPHMYSRACVWAETDNFGLIIVVEAVCIFKLANFWRMLAVDFMQLFFNTVFYIKPYRIIASSFMNTLWVCLHTVKDSFHVFASTFIRVFTVQFPSRNGRDEQAYILLCCDEIEITRGYCQGFSMVSGYASHFKNVMAGRTWAVVWRLFYSLLIWCEMKAKARSICHGRN